MNKKIQRNNIPEDIIYNIKLQRKKTLTIVLCLYKCYANNIVFVLYYKLAIRK